MSERMIPMSQVREAVSRVLLDLWWGDVDEVEEILNEEEGHHVCVVIRDDDVDGPSPKEFVDAVCAHITRENLMVQIENVQAVIEMQREELAEYHPNDRNQDALDYQLALLEDELEQLNQTLEGLS